MMALVLWVQQIHLPPVDDVVRWVFYGIGGWIAVQTWMNSKSLAFLTGRAVKLDDLDVRLANVETKVDAMPDRITTARDQAVDRVQELITDMELRLTERRPRSR